MGQVKDRLIEREERAQAARGKCKVCGERLQPGEEEVCGRHAWEDEHS